MLNRTLFSTETLAFVREDLDPLEEFWGQMFGGVHRSTAQSVEFAEII